MRRRHKKKQKSMHFLYTAKLFNKPFQPPTALPWSGVYIYRRSHTVTMQNLADLEGSRIVQRTDPQPCIKMFM